MRGPSFESVSQASHAPIAMAINRYRPDHRELPRPADCRSVQASGIGRAHDAIAANMSRIVAGSLQSYIERAKSWQCIQAPSVTDASSRLSEKKAMRFWQHLQCVEHGH